MPRALFVSSILGHKKFEERYEALLRAGYECRVVAANWAQGRVPASAGTDPSIRTVKHRPAHAPLARMLMWLAYLRELARLRLRGERFDLVVANTIEMAVLAHLAYGGVGRKIVDLADIHAHQSSRGLVGKLLRRIEYALGKARWSYVVTSPWFYWGYLLPLVRSPAPAYLVENGVLAQQAQPTRAERREAGPIRILWNGVLRCNTSAELLAAVAEQWPDEVQVTLAGTLDLLQPHALRRLLALRNVSYAGAYDDRLLATLFASIDVVWVADFDDGLNSTLLLPNRLYQAMHFRKPAIAVGDSATARCVRHFGIGVACASRDPATLMQAMREVTSTPLPVCATPRTTFFDVLRGTTPRLPQAEDFAVLAAATAAPRRSPGIGSCRVT